MSKNQEVKINFFKKFNIWRFYVVHETYQAAGKAMSLSHAERQAFELVKNLPNVDVVYAVYESGKKVKKRIKNEKE